MPSFIRDSADSSVAAIAASARRLQAVLVLGLLCLIFISSTHAQPASLVVAEVTVVIGKARVQQNGQWRAIKSGDQILEESRLETDADGYVYIKTADRGFISLRPNSALSFDTYRYDPANPTDTLIKLTLHKGVMRSVSGVGAQNARDKFRLNTPVAAIGIRGTDFSTFTDDQTTLVTVRTGGIVAAPFQGNCLPTGIGPCNGENSLDLLAAQSNHLLQVKLGEIKPQMLERSQQERTPDKVAPPLPDEGNRAQSISKSPTPGALPLADMAVADSISTATPTPTPTPAIVPDIYWGRWQSVARLSATETLDAFNSRINGTADLIKRPYVMARAQDPAFKLPETGVFNFALRASDAYIFEMATRTASVASVSNAVLSIDFARRQFNTSLDLTAGQHNVNVYGSGTITDAGMLRGNRSASNASIDGMLAGADATQAGYLFNTPTQATGLSAAGATFWAR
jgi:hypothetical protein